MDLYLYFTDCERMSFHLFSENETENVLHYQRIVL